MSWVNVNESAVSSVDGNSYFVPPSDEVVDHEPSLLSCSSVGYLASEPTTGNLKVSTLTLDTYAEDTAVDQLSLVKIDVEGAEVDVLIGAENVIRRFRPVLAIEYNSGTLRRNGTSVYALDELLESYGYDRFLYYERFSRFVLRDWFDPSKPDAVLNVYCFPRSS
jgi:FkbM family methyltransferase